MKWDVEQQKKVYTKVAYALAVLYNGFYILHYNFILDIHEFNLLIIPTWLALALGPPLVHLLTKNYKYVVWTLLFGVIVTLVAFMWTCGGIRAPSAIWLTALPPAVGLLLGRKEALWSSLIIAVIFVLLVMYSDYAPNIIPEPDEYLVHKIGNLVIYFGFLMSTLAIYQFHDRQEKQILIEESESTENLFKVLLHDVGNDLSSIFATVERLREDPQQTDFAISKLEKRLNNLVNLIEQLRQIKKFNNSKELLNATPLCITSLLNEANSHCFEAAQSKNIRIQFELSNERLFILGEESLFLHTILLNFLSNAIKFSHAGGTIKLRSYRKESFVFIEIEDFGVGIPPELQSQLFMVKNKVSRPGTEGEKGSGYGLTLAKRYIEMHHGELKIVSTPQKQGTLVTLCFPQFIEPKNPQPTQTGDFTEGA